MQVTDTTTFTDDRRREELDAWLYETCTQCLQHMVDIVVQFYDALQPLLSRIFDLLANFIRSAQAAADFGLRAQHLLKACLPAVHMFNTIPWRCQPSAIAALVLDAAATVTCIACYCF